MKVTSAPRIWKWLICLIITCLFFLTAEAQCPAGQRRVTISIRTDLFGSETTWGLYNQATSALVTSGGPYGNNTTYTSQICVDTTNCYYFVIYDIGDGICCGYGPGSYSVTYGTTVIGTGGQFTSSETVFGIGSCIFPPPLVTDNTTYTTSELVTDVLLGSCVSAFNITYTGAPAAIGYFSNGAALGIDNGLLLTTGNTAVAPGPNRLSEASYEPGTPGDLTLEAVSGVSPTKNAASLKFDFISYNDTVTFRYIFASEEYNEFVCSQFNDVFAFLITGPGYAPNTNIALIPGTTTPVAINSVNIGSPGIYGGVAWNSANCTSLSNTSYYVDNTVGLITEFDGYTVPLSATMVVVPCDTYHIKIVVADVSDEKADSGIFLEAESFSAGSGINILASTIDGTKNAFEGCFDGVFTFSREDTANLNSAVTISFTLSGSATEVTDFQTIPHSVTILPNQMIGTINIVTLLDGISEGSETVIISYQDVCSCTSFKTDTLFIFDNQPLAAAINGDSIICIGESATLAAAGSGSVSTPFQYSWSSSQSTSSITISPVLTTTYTVTITDECAGQTATDSHTVTVASTITADFSNNSPQCFSQNNFDFINTSSYSGSATFHWDISDGTIATSTDVVNHTFAAPGIYNVLLTVNANGCSDSVTHSVSVSNSVFSNASTTICSDSSVFAGGAFQNTSGTYYDTLTAFNGCDSVIITSLNVIDSSITNITVSICSGDSIFADGLWQFTPGIYFDIFSNSNGCDSTIITTLNVLNHSSTSLSISICEGDSVFAGGTFQNISGTYRDTLSAANGCDSVVTTSLTINDTSVTNITASICFGDSVFAGGTWQFSSGIYFDIFSNSNGCDSTIITTLNVLNHSSTSLSISICEGDSVFAGGTFQNISGIYRDTLSAANGCDSVVATSLTINDTSVTNITASICFGDSVFAGGTWQFSSGIYFDIFSNSNGCDSTIITTLNVLNHSSTSLSISICEGDSVFAGGTFQNISGIYRDTLSAANGCDSVVTTSLTVNDTSVTNIIASICFGDSVFAGGTWQFSSGIYFDIFSNSNGCDSTIITTLNVLNHSSIFLSISICEGDSVFAGGTFQNISGIYRDTLSAANGCDSVVTTSLTVNDTSVTNITASICFGDSVFAGGTWQFSSGIYFDIFSNSNGCDSTIITTLNVLNHSSIFLSISICEGDSVFAGGTFQNISGIYRDTLSAANGCDSVVTTSLTVNDTSVTNITASICSGDSVFAAGAWQNLAGTYLDNLTSSRGCDSAVITHLAVDSIIQTQINSIICQGDSIFVGGTFQNSPGTYLDVYSATGGCDSIVTTNIFVADTFLTIINTSICEGDSVFANGAWQKTSGIYFDQFTTAAGCDSSTITNLTVINIIQTTTDISLCDGQSYFAGGLQQTTSGIYTDVYLASTGCDSSITTNLTVSDTFLHFFSVSICASDSFFTGGTWQKFPGSYADYLTSISNCDSIIVTNLDVDSIINTPINISICEGESYFVGGTLQTTSGIYTDHFNAVGGCDSIVTTTLSVSDTFIINLTTTICRGDSVFAGGLWQKDAGVYLDSLSSTGGCDSVVATNLFVTNIIYTQADTTICFGDSILIAGSFQKTPETYSDTFTATGGCDSIHAIHLSVIQIYLTGDTTIVCVGDSITLVAPSGFATYQWSPGGEINPSITVLPGSYQLMVTDANGCSAIANFTVNESNPIGLYAVPDSVRIIEGESIQIQILNSSSSSVSNYVWTPVTGLSCAGCSTAVASPLDDIIYTVIATDNNGCTEMVTLQIFVDTIEIPAFYIPNAFTPNRDGMNDHFRVYGRGFTLFNLKVFDRWGEKLFETSNPNIGWDGTFRGHPCNPGVYVYYVDAKFINNFYPTDYRKYQKGSVTLIR